MKKNIVLLALTLSISVTAMLTGCLANPGTDQNKGYQTYYLDGSDSVGSSGEIQEFPLWSSEALNGYNDSTAKKSATVTFEGKSYSGEYTRSEIEVPNLNTHHRYLGGNCSFNLDSKSGELVSFLLGEDFTPTFSISEEEGRKLADEFAKKYINLSEYKVEIKPYDKHNNCVYFFFYYREVDGLKTNDMLSVALNGRGRVVSFELGMLGSFSYTRAKIDEEKADTALREQLDSAYEKYANKTYTIEDKTLIKLPDGKQGIIYTVEINIVWASELDDTEDAVAFLSQMLVVQ